MASIKGSGAKFWEMQYLVSINEVQRPLCSSFATWIYFFFIRYTRVSEMVQKVFEGDVVFSILIDVVWTCPTADAKGYWKFDNLLRGDKVLDIHEMLIMFAQKIYMAKIAEHLKIFNLAYVILLNSCDLNSYKI